MADYAPSGGGNLIKKDKFRSNVILILQIAGKKMPLSSFSQEEKPAYIFFLLGD